MYCLPCCICRTATWHLGLLACLDWIAACPVKEWANMSSHAGTVCGWQMQDIRRQRRRLRPWRRLCCCLSESHRQLFPPTSNPSGAPALPSFTLMHTHAKLGRPAGALKRQIHQYHCMLGHAFSLQRLTHAGSGHAVSCHASHEKIKVFP